MQFSSCSALSWRTCRLAALLALFLGALTTRADVITVFLVGGQSNADGRADPAGLPTSLQSPQADVPFYYSSSVGLTTLRPGSSSTSQFGPEVTFGRSMANYYVARGGSVGILKYAAGGTNLYSQWKAGGDGTTTGDGPIYQNFEATIKSGLLALQNAHPTSTLVIGGMIWMQGESDADSDAHGLAYQGNLMNFISDIRATYGNNLPFVIGELSSNQTGTGAAEYRNEVMNGQVATAAITPYSGLVNTNSFALNPDNLHFIASGQQALGYAIAASMQSLVPEPSSSTLCLAVLGGLTVATAVSRLRKSRVPPLQRHHRRASCWGPIDFRRNLLCTLFALPTAVGRQMKLSTPLIRKTRECTTKV